MRIRNGCAQVVALAAITVPMACSDGESKKFVKGSDDPSTSAPKVTGAIADLTGFSCGPDKARRWQASGKLTNGSTRTRTYNLTVSVINPNNSEVYGEKSVEVKLEAGAGREVTVKNIDKGHSKQGRCTPFVTVEEG